MVSAARTLGECGCDVVAMTGTPFAWAGLEGEAQVRAGVALSYRDIEEMLATRGIDVSYETVRRWFLNFGPGITANLRHLRPRPSDHRHLDEVAVKTNGKRHWLWRAVDNEGEVLDFLVQTRRNANTARKLMRKLLKKQGFAPTRAR